jgi:integrase
VGLQWVSAENTNGGNMAYIEKRILKNGKVSYRARIRKDGVPEESKSFPTRREADLWSKRIEAGIIEDRYFGRDESKKRTFAQLVDRYIEKELPKNPKAYKKQKMMLTWWKAQLGKYFLCHVTAPMIADLRDKLLSQTTYRHKLRTPSTTNRWLACLSRMCAVAIKEYQWLKINPVKDIQRPKENKAKDRYLEKDEINKLLESCSRSRSPHLYAVVAFLLATGARKSEALAIKIGDLDFNRSTVTFRATKNGSDRTLHLSQNVLDILRNEKEKRAVFSEYFFPSMDGKKPACIRGAFERAVANCGLQGVTLHTLRHTMASHLGMSGFSVLEIGRCLGHKSMACTVRYSHMSTASTARPLNALNEEILGNLINVGQTQTA